ncbi:hypothetical protein MBH78_14885 [Oceanimonas sp. NS1]|nr:hypothetical protein [Oceanimonas sp. NS1]
MLHTVEKIGGTSMSQYQAVRDNIVLYNRNNDNYYQRMLVVSALWRHYRRPAGVQAHRRAGVYATFADAEDDQAWEQALDNVCQRMAQINEEMFGATPERALADAFCKSALPAFATACTSCAGSVPLASFSWPSSCRPYESCWRPWARPTVPTTWCCICVRAG